MRFQLPNPETQKQMTAGAARLAAHPSPAPRQPCRAAAAAFESSGRKQPEHGDEEAERGMMDEPEEAAWRICGL